MIRLMDKDFQRHPQMEFLAISGSRRSLNDDFIDVNLTADQNLKALSGAGFSKAQGFLPRRLSLVLLPFLKIHSAIFKRKSYRDKA